MGKGLCSLRGTKPPVQSVQGQMGLSDIPVAKYPSAVTCFWVMFAPAQRLGEGAAGKASLPSPNPPTKERGGRRGGSLGWLGSSGAAGVEEPLCVPAVVSRSCAGSPGLLAWQGRAPARLRGPHSLPGLGKCFPSTRSGSRRRVPTLGGLRAQLSPSPQPAVGSLPLHWSLRPLSFTPPQRRGRTILPQHPGLLLLVAAPAETPRVTLQESTNPFFHHF